VGSPLSRVFVTHTAHKTTLMSVITIIESMQTPDSLVPKATLTHKPTLITSSPTLP
jgi:hypothetical protein